MDTIKKYKWIIHWTALAVLVMLFVYVAIYYEEKPWIANVLQAIGTIAGIYITLIVFLHSKEESDKQFREHLEHLQKLNTNHIDALKNSTEAELKTLQELNTKHITALNESTQVQIKTLQDLTEKQIDALHKSTQKQIENYSSETTKVIAQLTDNSVLLAEILKRQLEEAIVEFGNKLSKAKANLIDLRGFKLFRSKQEREEQITAQSNEVEILEQWLNYLNGKYSGIRKYLKEE